MIGPCGSRHQAIKSSVFPLLFTSLSSNFTPFLKINIVFINKQKEEKRIGHFQKV